MIRTKDYLSWSQYSLWKKSKREYWKRYGLLEDNSHNRYFSKGKELADAMQFGDDNNSEDELLGDLINIIPRLDIQEDKIEVVLDNGEKILCFVDSASADNELFYEYKTGKNPWTQELVDKHDQLLFYSLAYYIKSGRKSIPSCKLIWIETEEVYDESRGYDVLRYTGSIEEFERNFILAELVDLEKDIIKSIAEIDAFEYIELPLDETLVDRYIELSESRAAIEEEMNTIKLEIEVNMNADEVDYASSSKGRFSFTRRKTWFYSEELTKEETRLKKAIDEAKKAEIKDGTANFTENKYLTFKPIK